MNAASGPKKNKSTLVGVLLAMTRESRQAVPGFPLCIAPLVQQMAPPCLCLHPAPREANTFKQTKNKQKRRCFRFGLWMAMASATRAPA